MYYLYFTLSGQFQAFQYLQAVDLWITFVVIIVPTTVIVVVELAAKSQAFELIQQLV